MKIGILTFHCAANYGAILQAYALQETLKSLGHEVYILDYRPKFLLYPYRPFVFRKNLFKQNPLKEFIRAFAYLPIRIKRKKKFNEFTNNYLNLLSFDQYKNLDAIIIGSDQVWGTLNFGDIDDTYFLNFDIPDSILKISYAASAGSIGKFEKNLTQTHKDLLKKFDQISVRENLLAQSIQKHLGLAKEPPTVLDPVLLAGRKIFEKFIDRNLVPKDKYVLSFSLGYDPNLIETTKNYASQNGLQSVNMISMSESFRKDLIETADISRFLSLIYYADAVFTTSFHGSAFSILFNRPFKFIGYDKNHAERVLEITKLLNIQGVIIDKRNLESNKIHKEDNPTNRLSLNNETLNNIDYNEVNVKLKNQRGKSINYLTQSLLSK